MTFPSRSQNQAPRAATKPFAGRSDAPRNRETRPNVARFGSTKRTQSTLRRGGFSLLEVTIALVIFVVGALAIVRIFPGALDVVQTSENRGIGARISQTTLSRYDNDPLSAPYAIYDFEPHSDFNAVPGRWSDFPGAVAGTRNNGLSLPTTPPVKDDTLLVNYYQSAIGQAALGRYRYVMGEACNVPAAAQTNVITTRFPYTSGTLKAYREVDVNGVTINDTGDLNFSQATIDSPSALVPQDAAGTTTTGRQIFHDTDLATADRPPARYRRDGAVTNFTIDRQNTADPLLDPTYYISYRYIDGAGRVQGINDEPKEFPNNGGDWSALNTRVLQAYTAPRIVSGPVKVRVRLRYLFIPTTFSEPAQAVRGIGIYQPTSTGNLSAGERISFDYLVRDWRWLTVDGSAATPVPLPTDDNNVPIPPPNTFPIIPRQLQLPIRYVTRENPNSNDAPLYSMLSGRTDAGVPTQPGLGEWSPETYPAPSHTNPTGFNLWEVEPKSGRLVFNVGRGATAASAISPSTADVRVVYRSVDGWGHQVSVGAKQYIPFVQRTIGNLNYNIRHPWREYFADVANHKLYFHPGDAGHSLMVSFEYLDRSVTPNVFRSVVNQMVTLSNRIVVRPTSVDAAFCGSARASSGTVITDGVIEGTLLDLNGLPIDGTKAQISAITSVQGISIRARSAWVDGDQYSQTGAVGYRKNLN